MKAIRFICQFFRHPKQVGTPTQSSRFLARKIAEQIDGSIEIVEFGAGTGAVTQEILKRLPKNGRLVCFEINPSFCRDLEKINDSRLKVINDDARNCRRYVDDPDCIVSGLPLALFARSKKNRILAITRKTKRYIQLQYTPLLTRQMKRHFPEVELKFVPRNFPPAFIYVCKNSVK